MAVTCLGDTDIPYNETDYSQSPNISTLGQFGDIPVSQFTGVPKISIPICKIEINGKSIPITLDYHTSGIRMEQKPGWIGAGWSLMAAGAIVRLQNGGNDEYQHFMKKKNIIYGGQGYFQNLNDLNNDNWGTQSFLNDFIENYNSTYLSLNQDLDPDEFRFDFLGHSGSFFKDCQGQWQIRSKENFRIADMSLGKVPYEAPDNLGKPDVIVGFTLIGDNGGLIIGNQADYSCEYAYDLNGNITSLTRNGVAMSVQAFDFKCWNFGMIDDAKFEYDGNQLIRAYDDCESLTYAAAMDFKARTAKSNQYSWDANGNMTSDMNRNITKITYNFLNLPYEIHFADGHINRYTYTSDGRKLRVEYMISNTGVIDARDYGEFSSSPLPSRVNEVPNSAIEGTFNDTHDAVSLQTIMTKSYCGDLEYLNNEIERVDNDYGYWAGGRYHYYIKDYQGNVRAVIDEAGRLEEVNNYYPYGGLMGAAGSGVQPRKYGGKELDRENGLDWYDSQARHYDPTTGRTPTMDSKAESYYSLSPYLWCAGNPVRNIDPTGMYFDQATTNQAGLYIEQLNERIAELNHSNAEDRAEQLAEVARSLQDIEDMRNDEKRRYIFVSVVGVPETIQLADGSIQMNIDENMPGNYAHEIKHGGQIARNEFGYTNGHPDERYGASHEVNAYKAQLSSCGQISYMPNYDFDANPNISLKIALLGQKSAWITVSNIKDISTTFLKSIYEGPGVHIWQLYSEKRYGKEWFEK